MSRKKFPKWELFSFLPWSPTSDSIVLRMFPHWMLCTKIILGLPSIFGITFINSICYKIIGFFSRPGSKLPKKSTHFPPKWNGPVKKGHPVNHWSESGAGFFVQDVCNNLIYPDSPINWKMAKKDSLPFSPSLNKILYDAALVKKGVPLPAQ